MASLMQVFLISVGRFCKGYFEQRATYEPGNVERQGDTPDHWMQLSELESDEWNFKSLS